MSIRVAATLDLVELAGSAGATAEQLASETGTATPALRCLLDHLVTIGVFDLDMGSGQYRPTDLGAQLSEDAPEGIKPLLDINSAGGRNSRSSNCSGRSPQVLPATRCATGAISGRTSTPGRSCGARSTLR
jgi:hypothetical protein